MARSRHTLSWAAMDWQEFTSEVEGAIAELPPEFRAAVENVAVLLEDEADRGTREEMELAHPLDLLGLYRGIPLPDRGSSYAGAEPDQVYLYRRAILAYARANGLTVEACIRNVLVHELGHYIGYDDEQLERIEHDLQDGT